MDIQLDLDTFLLLIQEIGLPSALGVGLFIVVARAFPHVMTAWKEDRQASRDHQYRMAELVAKHRERVELDFRNGTSSPNRANQGE